MLIAYSRHLVNKLHDISCTTKVTSAEGCDEKTLGFCCARLGFCLVGVISLDYTHDPELTRIVSATPKYKLYLVQLPDENQKHIRHCIKLVSNSLRRAASRLHGYESENAEAMTESVIKTIEDLRQTIAITEAMLSELVEAHGLPDDLRLVPDQYRKDFKELLTGTS